MTTDVRSEVSRLYPARVHRPVFSAPEHRAEMDEIVHLAGHAFEGGRVPERFERIMRATGVQTRSYIRPAKQIFADGTGPGLWGHVVERLAELVVRAAGDALAAAAIEPERIDALVLTSVTGYAMPNLDVHLIRELGMRPTVRRIPVCTIGCAGGVYGLIRAREQVLVYPDACVLVVTAEAFSSVLQPTNTDVSSLIYKALGGDGASAVIVTHPDHVLPGPAVGLYDPIELLVPATEDNYRLAADSRGHLGFASTAQAPRAILKAADLLTEWRGTAGTPGFTVAHHGGPAILERTAAVLGADRHHLRHSWSSLAEHGNMGSTSIMDILARCLDDPAGPEQGESGIMLAIGPGVTIDAARIQRLA